jgi:hypothetical protein
VLWGLSDQGVTRAANRSASQFRHIGAASLDVAGQRVSRERRQRRPAFVLDCAAIVGSEHQKAKICANGTSTAVNITSAAGAA